jgi:hypothetical protein
LKLVAMLQIALKMIIFRDKYYSRITKLYYFGIYVKLIFERAFTMSNWELFVGSDAWFTMYAVKSEMLKTGECALVHIVIHMYF